MHGSRGGGGGGGVLGGAGGSGGPKGGQGWEDALVQDVHYDGSQMALELGVRERGQFRFSGLLLRAETTIGMILWDMGSVASPIRSPSVSEKQRTSRAIGWP